MSCTGKNPSISGGPCLAVPSPDSRFGRPWNFARRWLDIVRISETKDGFRPECYYLLYGMMLAPRLHSNRRRYMYVARCIEDAVGEEMGTSVAQN